MQPLRTFLAAAACLAAAVPAVSHADLATRRTPVVVAVEKVQDAVVSISTDELVRMRVGGSEWYDEYFRGYYGRPHYKQGYRQMALGSGVIIDPKGYVVTNYHVVRRGARIRVHLRDGRELVAKVVGTDPDSDLALLQVDAGGPLPAAPLGDSGSLMLGETVIAIGNPFGLSHTVSTGIVSALHRNLDAKERPYFDFIQTDASINPGNSGGPLLDIDGEIVGINSAIYGKAQGIGFAIPSARVRRVVGDLVHYGRVRESWLGLMVAPIENSDGVVVTDLLDGSPAKGAVQVGDVITGLAGRPVGGTAEYRFRLRDIKVGAEAKLSLLRNGDPTTAEVRTREIPDSAAEQILARYVGIEVKQITRTLRRRLDLPVKKGLVVSRILPRSEAARIGLRVGDVVRAVNAVEVSALGDLREMILHSERSGELVLVIQRGRYLSEVSFKL